MAEHANAVKAPVATVAPKGKVAVRAHASESVLERDADRMADSIARGPRAVQQQIERLPHAMRGTPGRVLDVATRAVMEGRFGFDFRHVRIHDDDGAGRLADSQNALAYTRGANIVFSRGAYAPHSRDGARLLAHELTHVVQQAHNPVLAGTIQRKPDPKTKPAPTPVWYQEAIDNVQLELDRQAKQRKEIGFVFDDPFFPAQKAVLKLCEDVDKKAVDVVPTDLDKLLKEGLAPMPTMTMSRELLTELSARIFELGLEADAERLRKAYAANDKFGPYNDDIYAARRKVDFLTRLVKGASADAKGGTPAEVTASLHQFARAYVVLRDEYAKIDWDALKWEQQSGRWPMVMRPGMSHTEFYEAIKGQIELWLKGLSTFVQSVMDAARRDLELPNPTGSGAALLKALNVSWRGEIKDELSPKDEKKRAVLGEAFPITQTKMGKGKGTISDQFAQGKEAKARAVPVTTYNPEQDYVRELHASVVRFWSARVDQLDVLGRIYGILDLLGPEKTFVEQMQKAEKAKDTAESIRNTPSGRLRLDSDDDWREFLLQRYQDLTNPKAPAPATPQTGSPTTTAPTPAAKKALTPAEALHEIIDLLFKYLQAFTVHARYTNIYDVGEQSYLNRPFPRALTGQLVHDCGVYALRVAYILTLVRKELGLRFRFVVLPVHVSLVITGDKLPAFIVENDHFTEISASDLEERRKNWQQYKDPTTKQAPSGKADDEQFIGELAASEFIRGPIDMPFKVSDVPPPVKNAKAEQKQLWEYYQKTSTQELFGPSSKKKDDPNYLFHSNYLELTERFREAYNETFVPFWNKAAPDVWDQFLAKVKGTGGKPGATPRTKLKVDDLMNPVGEYRADFDDARKAVKLRYEALIDQEKRISQRLHDDPKLSKAGVRISVGARAMGQWRFYWETHADAINRYETNLINRPEGAEETVDAVQKALDPPFVPRDEKRVEPLD